MELAGHGYRQLAEEIGEVLQAAAETAEKMQEDARAEAARIREEAEAELRTAYAEGRRILDEARMEADMVRAEAEWQSQEVLAQARRQAAERMAGANTRLNDIELAEARVLDRLAGVGQILSDTMAVLRDSERDTALTPSDVDVPGTPEGWSADDDAEGPSAKVYFVEFPTPAPPAPEPAAVDSDPDPESDCDSGGHPRAPGIHTETADSLVDSDRERSEWAPPPDMPTWWTRDGAQG
jgi:vacuolar-type H+-ATPase subunit E/Vma4